MKLEKPYTDEQYADLAIYCNENGMLIADKGDYLEAVLPPEPTMEEKKERVRSKRNQYLKTYVDYYQSKPLLWNELTEKEKQNIINYRLYLKDYTKIENWYLQNPLTLDEWK